MNETLRVDTSVCRHISEIDPEQFQLWGGPAVDSRVLRRLDDDTIRSALVTLPAGWSGTLRAEAGVMQIFVRSGSLAMGDHLLGANGLVVLGGSQTQSAIAREATDLLVIFDPYSPEEGVPAGGPLILEDSLSIEPIIPVIDGKTLHGFQIRVIWVNPATGADTMLLHVPAGFQGGGPNWHPVNEEIFCLAGDIQPDETRPMRPGSFLWNPARAVHGFDERSEGGSILLEWHDGPWALTYAPDAVRPARQV